MTYKRYKKRNWLCSTQGREGWGGTKWQSCITQTGVVDKEPGLYQRCTDKGQQSQGAAGEIPVGHNFFPQEQCVLMQAALHLGGFQNLTAQGPQQTDLMTENLSNQKYSMIYQIIINWLKILPKILKKKKSFFLSLILHTLAKDDYHPLLTKIIITEPNKQAFPIVVYL